MTCGGRSLQREQQKRRCFGYLVLDTEFQLQLRGDRAETLLFHVTLLGLEIIALWLRVEETSESLQFHLSWALFYHLCKNVTLKYFRVNSFMRKINFSFAS